MRQQTPTCIKGRSEIQGNKVLVRSGAPWVYPCGALDVTPPHTDERDLTQMTLLSILLHRDGVATWHQASDSGGEIDTATIDIDPDPMPTGCRACLG